MTATAEPEIGKARTRKEDEHLVTGRTRRTDNLVLPGMQHLAILRSPFAHARITGVDASAAREMPGSTRLSVQRVRPVTRCSSSLRFRAFPISGSAVAVIARLPARCRSSAHPPSSVFRWCRRCATAAPRPAPR